MQRVRQLFEPMSEDPSYRPLCPSERMCQWTWSIVWRLIIWSSHTILYPSSISREYVSLVQLFEDHSFQVDHPSSGCRQTLSIIWIPLVWSSHLILLSHVQRVRELVQLFEDLSPDHPISSSFSFCLQFVCELGLFFDDFSNLIIPSHFLHPSPGRTWTLSIVEDLSLGHLILFGSRGYVNFVN